MITGRKSFIDRETVSPKDGKTYYFSMLICDHEKTEDMSSGWYYKNTEASLIGQTVVCGKCGASQVMAEEHIL